MKNETEILYDTESCIQKHKEEIGGGGGGVDGVLVVKNEAHHLRKIQKAK